MPITKDAVSTTNTSPHFQTETLYSGFRRRKMVFWDYRDSKGKLHSGISRTVHRARLAAQRASNETID